MSINFMPPKYFIFNWTHPLAKKNGYPNNLFYKNWENIEATTQNFFFFFFWLQVATRCVTTKFVGHFITNCMFDFAQFLWTCSYCSNVYAHQKSTPSNAWILRYYWNCCKLQKWFSHKLQIGLGWNFLKGFLWS